MATNSVSADPKKCGMTKQNASALGITNVGSGHNWRLAREINDVFSRNIAGESSANGT